MAYAGQGTKRFYSLDAQAYRDRLIAESKGEAERFLSVYQAYKLYPDITRRRIYLETVQKVLQDTDKVILDGSSGAIPYLPLDVEVESGTSISLIEKSMEPAAHFTQTADYADVYIFVFDHWLCFGGRCLSHGLPGHKAQGVRLRVKISFLFKAVPCALHLQRLGATVTLIDRQEPGGVDAASYGNAGALARCSVVPVATPGILRKAHPCCFRPTGLCSCAGPICRRSWSTLRLGYRD